MSEDSEDLRRSAEGRVRFRFERQDAALTKWQSEIRTSDTLFQTRAVEASLAHQATLEHDKARALAEHDKRWKEARDRLTPRPGPAPAFGMMGGPPMRNLAKDHDDLRRRGSDRREAIIAERDEGIAACITARAAMRQGFARGNEARDQGHQEDRLDLAQKQAQAFDRLVKKELDRADQWNSRTFNRRSRDDNSRDL